MPRIEYSPRAEKEYQKLPPDIQDLVKNELEPHLTSDPFRHPGKGKIKKYKGVKFKDQYRYRLTYSWRCMYRVEPNKVVILYFYKK